MSCGGKYEPIKVKYNVAFFAHGGSNQYSLTATFKANASIFNLL